MRSGDRHVVQPHMSVTRYGEEALVGGYGEPVDLL